MELEELEKKIQPKANKLFREKGQFKAILLDEELDQFECVFLVDII